MGDVGCSSEIGIFSGRVVVGGLEFIFSGGGLLEGSKFTILILGKRISGTSSNSIALAVRFLFRGVEEEEGEEEDIVGSCLGVSQ